MKRGGQTKKDQGGVKARFVPDNSACGCLASFAQDDCRQNE
jgi:hypothetical protein